MKRSSRSRLAPSMFPRIPPIAGVRLTTQSVGIKYARRHDLLLAECVRGSTVAGVFTRSTTAAAPVVWCREQLSRGRIRGLVVNSGNANAFTGLAGEKAVRATAAAAAQALGCLRNQVFVASTGVIGEPLPLNRLTRAMPQMVEALAPGGWGAAARAICTTDTFIKGAWRRCEIDGHEITLGGIAKGSGMIAPNMGTMLAFLFTNARIPSAALQAMLRASVETSFNSITVDSDTSTSDTVLLVATGRSNHPPLNSPHDPKLRDFRRALDEVMVELATQVVRDGEGASKFVTIEVSGASSWRMARRVGLSIANSPLVKTAIAGEDPNWGRIVMAVGKSGVLVDSNALSISMGGTVIAQKGERLADYDEATVALHLKTPEVHIGVDLGQGRGKATVWTCDLTHGYIEINADYRT
jgi:glutamate N-acetyltransferase/amino-acid N-acetyltransferase